MKGVLPTNEREAGKRATAFQKGPACHADGGCSYSTRRTSEREAAAAQGEAGEADPEQPHALGWSPPGSDHHDSPTWWLDVPVTILLVTLTFMEFPLHQRLH